MTFVERVEQRARELFNSWHAKYDADEEMCIELFRQDARREIILSWAAANQGAMEALVEEKAGVYLDYTTEQQIEGKSNLVGARLDTPQEKN